MKMNTTLLAQIRKGKAAKILSAFLALNLLFEIISPGVAMALTAGASAPEFSSFEPVATTDMVNEFTGDFTYNLPVLNVPGPDGGSYAMSLSYHSGASSEEEASWVGFGWTLNPGAINRQKQGFPDDFKRTGIETYNKVKPNWTQTAKFDFNMEYSSRDDKPEQKSEDGKGSKKIKSKLGLTGFGKKENEDPKKTGLSDPSDISVSLSHSVKYNNYTGFSISNGFGLSVMGMANMNMNVGGGGQATYGFSVNPLTILRAVRKKAKLKNYLLYKEKTVEKPSGDPGKPKKIKHAIGLKNNIGAASYPIQSFTAPALPYSVAKHSGAAWNFSASLQVNPASIPVGFQMGVAGSMNIQANEGLENQRVFGYMYSAGDNYNDYDDRNDDSKTDVIFDYRMEKETTYDKNDKNLGIPFNNADIFSATGNGVVGGFKLMHDRIGHYYPNKSESSTKIRQLGVELGIGLTIQVGFDIGVGKQQSTVGGQWKNIIKPGVDNAKFLSLHSDINTAYTAWAAQQPAGAKDFDNYLVTTGGISQDDMGVYTAYKDKLMTFSSTDPIMRFTNDPGGEVSYNNSEYDAIQFATIETNKNLQLFDFDMSMDKPKAQRSSYISYTKGEDNLITGIEITNKSGAVSTYDWPVYVRNEAQLVVGVGEPQGGYGNKDGSYLCYQDLHYTDPLKNSTVIGQKVAQQYASTYLLTANKTFDYIDADDIPGPSAGDFGGWTKFDYRYAWGGGTHADQWYRYRVPYTGLHYDAGKLSDINDQKGAMSSGEKQICYLKTIETKTHIALFITNNTRKEDFPILSYPYLYKDGVLFNTLDLDGTGERGDGLDAAGIDPVTGLDLAANNPLAKGTHKLEKLERIVLLAKDDASRPLTTTYFKYDYSICPGIPNNTNYGVTPAAPAAETGKLTLKKVWTEGGGMIKSKIAPYQFNYEYFNNYPQQIFNRYPWAAAYNQLPDNDPGQNPRYAPEQLDMWGFYQENGKQRFEQMQPWVSQRAASAGFDPAVWQLKRIQLPSGGEIHVHYEQKDYCYVQDRQAMAMVSLKYVNGQSQNGYESGDSKYYINTEDFKNMNSAEIQAYTDKIKQYFINESHKLYFKALYTYQGDDRPQLNSKNPRYEYATGYTEVNNVDKDANGIFLELGHLKGKNDKDAKDRTLPRYVCFDNQLTNAGKNLGMNGSNYEDDDVYYTTNVFGDGKFKGQQELLDQSRNHVLKNTLDMFKDWVQGTVKNPKRVDACKQLNFELSYFKLPVFSEKKGGGIRVKRLISYDPGISGQSGDAVVYGSEYIYKKEDGTSSGVATNEPGGGREENALVDFLERKKQKLMDKLLNGQDLKQFEGPLGETLLPAASIVHERVVVQNIHNSNNSLTATGYAVNKYHTCRQYPLLVTNSVIAKSNKTYKKQKINIPLGLFNMDINKAWVTQGYLFQENDMNGKLQSQSTYPGVYSTANFDAAAYTSQTSYNYSAPGAKVRTLVYDPLTTTMQEDMLRPGKEEDYTMFMSNVHERTNNFSVEIDLNIGYFVPSFTLGFGLSYAYEENQLCQHVTSKVISHTTYLLSTTNTADGVTQTTENLAFDKYTGDPVLTRTFDGYMSPDEKIHLEKNQADSHNGHYYALNIPASWIYNQMGQTSAFIGNSNQLTASAGSIVSYGENQLYNAIKEDGEHETWNPFLQKLDNVINASSTVYQKNWFTNIDLSDYEGCSPGKTFIIKNKLKNHFYPYRTYVYRDEVTNANNDDVRIYNGGTIKEAFEFMNWANLIEPENIDNVNNSNQGSVFRDDHIEKWYSPSEIMAYSPYGSPVEEKDALGISSTAKFGYSNTLPVLVAQNAKNKEVQFLDFEVRNQPVVNYIKTTEAAITKETAHSGQSCLNFKLKKDYVFAKQYPISYNMITLYGLNIKLWLKSELNDAANKGLKNPNPKLNAVIGNQLFPFKKVAETGEWALYAVEIKNFNGLSEGLYDIKLAYNELSDEKIFVDDFRIQPLNSMMNCTVYTDDNKVAAQFDDQHFGVYYEYNMQGQLVRKSAETERGRKTLQEQQYNTPLKERKDELH